MPNYEYKGSNFRVELVDTVSRGDYDEIRPKQYPNTNLILICFALISEGSFKSVKERWVPEVERYSPETPVLLVGTKQDLRNDPELINNLKQKKQSPVQTEQGKDLAKEIGAVGYFEYSGSQKSAFRFFFFFAADSLRI